MRTDDEFDIVYSGRVVAQAERRGDRIYVTAVYGSKKGQSLGVVSGESAARSIAAQYIQKEDTGPQGHK